MSNEIDATSQHKDIYGESIARDAAEQERMDRQFRLISRALGWVIHPSIVRSLSPASSVADFATGTGIFLRSLRGFYPEARLDGYDLSDGLFPAERGHDVNLSVADIKKPLSAELHGIYDLVHVRYVTYGMEPDDWETALQNVLLLLKPGGAIQWVEPDMTHLMFVRGRPTCTVPMALRKLNDFVHTEPVQPRVHRGWNTLPNLMEKQGLRVETDVVSADRVAENRRALTEIILGALKSAVHVMTGRTASTTVEGVEIGDLERAAEKEIEEGWYASWEIHTAVGFKEN